MAEVHSFVTFQVEGVHCWPDAPDHLLHLRSPHRHQFHFKVTFPQRKDRGIEFHEYRQYCMRVLSATYGREAPLMFAQFYSRSCEAIALHLAQALVVSTQFPVNYVTVAVSEDGEFGSSVYVDKVDLI